MRDKIFDNIGQVLDPSNFYKTNRKIKKIIVHCSATNNTKNFDAHDIDRWHLNRGFAGIGYHYVVLRDGTLQKGRWTDAVGAHASGHNNDTIGICYIGGLDGKGRVAMDGLTPKQHKTLITTLKTLMGLYGLYPADVLGHNELPKVTKSCPCLNMSDLRRETACLVP